MAAPAQPTLRDSHLMPDGPTIGRGNWRDGIRRAFQGWRASRAGRRALASLTERDFQDIGHTRWELEYELARPFWRG